MGWMMGGLEEGRCQIYTLSMQPCPQLYAAWPSSFATSGNGLLFSCSLFLSVCFWRKFVDENSFTYQYSRGGHALFLVNLFKKLHCAWRYNAIFYHDLVQNTTRISSWLSDFRVVSWTSSCSMSVFRYISYLFLQCSVLRYCAIALSGFHFDYLLSAW